ncbi:unnamed protein product [Toxocara canis]|uniref:Uncharacterized protein n=1 Tax=Toxocara canis TaxID=6265 RepID=A0A183UME0_TOXCA|nr:unnamed protein product [Toxocara canis]
MRGIGGMGIGILNKRVANSRTEAVDQCARDVDAKNGLILGTLHVASAAVERVRLSQLELREGDILFGGDVSQIEQVQMKGTRKEGQESRKVVKLTTWMLILHCVVDSGNGSAVADE